MHALFSLIATFKCKVIPLTSPDSDSIFPPKGAALSAISQNLDLLQHECSKLIVESGMGSSQLMVSDQPHQQQQFGATITAADNDASNTSVFSEYRAVSSPLRNTNSAPPHWVSPRFSANHQRPVATRTTTTTTTTKNLEQQQEYQSYRADVEESVNNRSSSALRQLFTSPRGKFNTASDDVKAKEKALAERELRLLDQSVTLFEDDLLSNVTAAHATMAVGTAAVAASPNSSSSSSSSSSASSIQENDVTDELRARVPSLFSTSEVLPPPVARTPTRQKQRFTVPTTPTMPKPQVSSAGGSGSATRPAGNSAVRGRISSSRRERSQRLMHDFDENVPPPPTLPYYEPLTDASLSLHASGNNTGDATGSVVVLPFQRGVWEARYGL